MTASKIIIACNIYSGEQQHTYWKRIALKSLPIGKSKLYLNISKPTNRNSSNQKIVLSVMCPEIHSIAAAARVCVLNNSFSVCLCVQPLHSRYTNFNIYHLAFCWLSSKLCLQIYNSFLFSSFFSLQSIEFPNAALIIMRFYIDFDILQG